MHRILLFGVALIAWFSIASITRAQSPRDEAFVRGDDLVGFGARHQWVLSSDAAMSIQNTRQRGTDRGSISVTVNPAADYFVIENLSIGASAGVQFVRSGGAKSTRVSVGPRIGYNVEITHLFSFWPRVGLSYSYSATREVVLDIDNHAVSVSAFTPLMMHPVAHFFIGFGPFIDVDLNGRTRGMLWGGRMTLGGWL